MLGVGDAHVIRSRFIRYLDQIIDILHIQGKEATNISKLKLNLFIPLSEVMLELEQWLN